MLSIFWQNFFKNKVVNYQIMRTADGKTTIMLLNKDMNTNSILEIKLVYFKLEVVWVFLKFLLILEHFPESPIMLKKEFHYSFFPPEV